jgi:putative tryptophan/tyrosine transport system substrate-binding protein
MRRRDFIVGLGGAVAMWPVVAGSQQSGPMRRIGALISYPANDPEQLARIAAFEQGLQESGWTVGRNVQIDYRFVAGEVERYRTYAADLVALAPDILFAADSPSVAALQQATRTLPIVFGAVTDPVGAGYIANLAQPGGNTTGFAGDEYSLSGKRLQLLRQIAPHVTRIAVFRDPSVALGIGQFAAVQGAAPSFGVEVSPLDMRDAGEIERSMAAFALRPNGGLVVTAGAFGSLHRKLIITLAAKHQLPALYPFRFFVTDGGLISFGYDAVDNYRRAAGYVDRILKGEKPADLPVQAPTKFETVINLKTAKALGLTVPETLLATADEVIQ